jgi:predicted transporter
MAGIETFLNIMLTPGVRAASVAACGLANVSLRVFVVGLLIGEGLFLALHFFLGSILDVVWQQLTQSASGPLVVAIFIGLLLIGFGAWVLIRRHQRPLAPRSEIIGSAFEAFHEASCPVCLALGSIDRVNPAANVSRHLRADG